MGRYAVILVMTMTFALIAYSSGLQSNLNTAQQQLVESYNGSQAKNIAQSTALVAIQKIRDSNDQTFQPPAGQTFTHPSLNSYASWDEMKGEYRVAVHNQGDTLLIVNAVARVGQQTYQVEVEMNTSGSEWNPDLPFAVFSGSGMDLTGSSRIAGHAGTNATTANAVDLSWSTSIDSNLAIGPGGDPSTVVNQANFQNGNVGKSVTNLPTPANYELPKFPNFPPKNSIASSMHVSAWPATPPMLPSSYEGQYIPELKITGNATLTIQTSDQDRILHVGDMDIQQGHIKVEGDGKLEIFVEDKLNFNGSSTLNADRNQNKAFVYHRGTEELDFAGATNFNSGIYTREADLEITGSGGIQGNIITGGDNVTISGDAETISRAFYAPNANIELTGSAKVRGAMVAENFSASGAAQVIYEREFDSELPDLQSQQSQYKISYWK
ncbi:DUF2807 domain-containing protein [Aliifodinibius sp. S!AR15-10]|uniref:DUF7305 domain-containing protein n=1 Tax=Aliifodinibius sp. S!AR15-10 TaxID=2950437 RepID=UPI002860B851|nr:hypothetical protein [Aliifodinibius sp. S!AR15-10]MDR8392596.1 DUF2807 domain-containing protein [Aliifodinibius sp. S!AR15-10]